MKKRLICLLLFGFVLFTAFFGGETAFAEEPVSGDAGESASIEEMTDELDLSALERMFSELDENEQSLFGGDIAGYIKAVASGESGIDAESFFGYVLSAFGASVKEVLPLIASLAGIAAAVALIQGIKGNFAGSSTEKAASLAGVALCSVVVLLSAFSAIKAVGEFVTNLRTQCEAVFPVLFTLMTALGASGSIAVYQPAVAFFAFSVTELITVAVLPLVIASLVLGVVSGVTGESGGTESLSKVTASGAKWLMYTSFFLFTAFLSVKGATAAVCDNVSVRTAKFALSRYVPVIGGYLSDGFNAVLASMAVIKSAVGSTAILVMIVSALPVLMKTIVISLSLKLAEAVVGTFSDGKIKKVLSNTAGSINALIAAVAGVAFLYFIFLMLIIVSGNLVL